MKRDKAEQQGEKPEKKGKKKWIVVAVVVVVILAAAIGGGNSDDTKEPEDAAQTSEAVTDTKTEVEEGSEATEPEIGSYTLEHGELVEANENEIDGRSVLVVKAKISSSYNNDATVDQNYYNVEDLIQNQGCDKFDEIQYWAVADMSDGSESKVVSFTVDADLIQKIAEKSVAANQLGDYVADLYIHPSLSE